MIVWFWGFMLTLKGNQLFINTPRTLTRIQYTRINKGHHIFESSKITHLLVPKGEFLNILIMHKQFAFPLEKKGTNQSLNLLSKAYIK